VNTYNKVKNAMLAVQRYPWEQGVAAQSLYEADDITFIAMAHDAVLRQAPDGRFAVTDSHNVAVTDCAAVGEAVWRAYEHTGNDFYKKATEKMLDYLLTKAPRTKSGLICHNEVSFHEGFSPEQIWVDSCYMLPPFLAVMEKWEEAQNQLDGYLKAMTDPDTGLLFHIYDTGTGQFVRKKLWATGNGWALLGMCRMIGLSCCEEVRSKYIKKATSLLSSVLEYQQEDGMFHDILNESNTFKDGTSSMMTAAFIYRGIAESWLNSDYIKNADIVYENVQSRIDEFGIIRGVCGCPHFNSEGTSAEAQAAYIMMYNNREKVRKGA
jgi:rhamnogalacturonyl hydrolase YesR